MRTIRTLVWLTAIAVFLGQWAGVTAMADPLSIYTIQYTTDPDGISTHHGQTVDCFGGIVTHIIPGDPARVYLQDPAYVDGWGGIVVKDWTGDLVNGVELGNQV